MQRAHMLEQTRGEAAQQANEAWLPLLRAGTTRRRALGTLLMSRQKQVSYKAACSMHCWHSWLCKTPKNAFAAAAWK